MTDEDMINWMNDQRAMHECHDKPCIHAFND